MISPSNVMAKAEKKNAPNPVRTESESSVSRTLVVTLPQDHRRQHQIGVLAQVEHLDRVAVPAVGFDLKPQQTEAEDSQIEAGEQSRLQDTGNDAEPRSVVRE